MTATVNIPVNILKEGKRFVAYSPAFDLSTSGKTKVEARRHFNEALDLFLEELTDVGTFHRALTDLGWIKLHRTWKAPQVVETRERSIRIPA